VGRWLSPAHHKVPMVSRGPLSPAHPGVEEGEAGIPLQLHPPHLGREEVEIPLHRRPPHLRGKETGMPFRLHPPLPGGGETGIPFHLCPPPYGGGETGIPFRLHPRCKALAVHATWLPTFNLISTFHPLSNLIFHAARFLSDSLYASNTRYNGLHLFCGNYGHADHPDTAWGHPARL